MSSLFTLIWLVSVPAFILGLVNPKWSRMPSRKRAVVVYGGIFLTSSIGIIATTPTPKSTSDLQSQSQFSTSPQASARPSPFPEENPPSPQIPKVGQKVNLEEWELVVEKIEKLGQDLTYSDFGNIQQASGIWLVVNITLNNVGKQPRRVDPFNFKIVDSSGTEYEHYSNPVLASLYATKNKRIFLSSPIVPKGRVKSTLIFDLSPSSSGLKLKFVPALGKEQLVDLG